MAALLRILLLPSGPGAFRLWLALVVVFHHVTRVEVGKAPVLVFFALSGYWVHQVWQGRYRHCRRPYLTFLVSRWWRIAPVMVLASGLSLAVLAWLGDPAGGEAAAMPVRQALSAAFALGYAGMPVRPLGPAWSLDIEMQFYLVAPLLVLMVRRVPAVAALAAAYGVYAAGMTFYPELVLSSFLPFFVIGMVAAEHRWRVSRRLAAAGLGAAVALTAAIIASPWYAPLLGEGGDHWPAVNLLLAALVLPQALASAGNPSGARDKVWADQSYIVYLLHWPAIQVLRGIVWPGPTAKMLGLMVLAAVVTLLAWAVRRYCDRPLNRARARWVTARRVASDPADLPDRAKGDDRTRVFA
ncbi:MAG: acyltransferase [Pseudomonadota bacterium]